MSLLIPNWTLSARCFGIGISSFVLRRTSDVFYTLGLLPEIYFDTVLSSLLVQFVALVAIKVCILPSRFDVAWRAFFLGSCLNLGLTLAVYTLEYQNIGMYCVALSIFHWSEYMMQSTFNPSTTTVESYMLYHSNAYVVAFLAALVEYAVEYYIWPSSKLPNLISNIGISMVIFGECLRKSAMWTAKSNFNHYVQFEKDEEHELVTHGVYALFRHPSYVGWFWWSIGTQLILFNPVCVVLYAIASWKFFNDRIYSEEMTLLKFFGTKYAEYQGRVGIGIPFISGFIVPIINSETTAADETSGSKKDE